MTLVQRTGPETLNVIYAYPIVGASLIAGDFATLGSLTPGLSISQINVFTLSLEMDGNVSGDTSLRYTGANKNVLSPQTIAITET